MYIHGYGAYAYVYKTVTLHVQSFPLKNSNMYLLQIHLNSFRFHATVLLMMYVLEGVIWEAVDTYVIGKWWRAGYSRSFIIAVLVVWLSC